MSREAWGDPPDQQETPQLCPVCGGEWHVEGCELGEEVLRRMKAEDEAAKLRGLLSEAGALFRFYEQSHRAKGPGHEGKVERNAEIAGRIEAALTPNF